MPQPATPDVLLSRLRSAASSPRLVWYGPNERVELSGKVFDNWVAKTSNFLVDELDAGPGTRVRLDLPVHWKTLVWAMACWQVGAVVLPGDPMGEDAGPGGGSRADIVVSSAEGGAARAPAVLVAVALGALEMRWPSALPAGAVDYAAEVRAHGDVFVDAVPQAPGTPLISGTGAGELSAAALAEVYGAGHPPGSVVLLPSDATLVQALAAALRVWESEGTLILTHPEVPVSDSLLAGEKVTVHAAFPPVSG